MPHRLLNTAPRTARLLLYTGMATVLASVLYALFVVIPHNRDRAIASWRAQLELTAKDRQLMIERTLNRFLADVQTYASYPTAARLASLQTAPRAREQSASAVLHLRELMQTAVNYEHLTQAALVGAGGVIITQAGDAHPMRRRWLAGTAAEVMRTGRPAVRTSHENGATELYFGAPVRIHEDGRVAGAMVIAVDADTQLFPYVTAQWMKNRTGETLVVAQSEGVAVLLTRPRKPLSGRGGLRDSRIAAVAALGGRESFGEYVDYAGDKVFAVGRRIKGTNWALLVKIDRAEALHGANTEALSIAVMIFALLIAGYAATYAIISRMLTRHALEIAEQWEQRVRADEELQDTRQRLEALSQRARTLLEANVVGIAIGTAEGAVSEANDYYLDMIGYARAELDAGAVRWIDMTPAEHLAVDYKAIAELRTKGWSDPYEKQYIRKDGARIWVLMGDTMLPGPDEQILTYAVDITAQKQLEAQYLHAQKMEAVGRLAGGVAHDFNNILTAIKGIVSLAADELREKDPIRADLLEIGRCADRATALTSQLLAFSRRQVLQPRVFDVRDMIEQSERMLRRLIGEDVSLDISLAGGPLTVHADQAQLEQVLLNLVVNARDAMPSGGRLRVAARRVAEPAIPPGKLKGADSAVLLRVSDSGVGMSEEVLARVFEPFFTTKEQGKGTGLGLATVYGIVQQSHGTVEVTSAPGAGTSFAIYLPWVESQETQPEPAPASIAQSGRGVVLLVEDDDGVRALARRAIQRKGHQVIEARNPAEALLVAEKRFADLDLIVTDMVMPGMSGRELVGRLRKRHGKIDAIFMSGYSAGTADGLDDVDGVFLPKPFTPAQLISVVSRALATRPRNTITV